MSISDRIKERRLFMNYTQENLASKLGLQKSAIAKYENGRVENLKRSVILKMADILECTPSYLMGWEEENKKYRDVSKEKNDTEQLKIFKYYNQLNYTGKKEAEKRIEELTYIEKYTGMYKVNAAHEIEGATEEEKQNDDDIMNDENF